MKDQLEPNEKTMTPLPGMRKAVTDEKQIPQARVLVVDDDPVVCEMITAALIKIGFGVEKAGNGKQGLDRFLAEKYDLVITDFQMPFMNGFDLINKIKGIAPHIPIILFTGDLVEDFSPIGGQATVAQVLHKPIGMADFRQSVYKVMNLP